MTEEAEIVLVDAALRRGRAVGLEDGRREGIREGRIQAFREVERLLIKAASAYRPTNGYDAHTELLDIAEAVFMMAEREA